MKKTIAMLLACLMALFLLTGCGAGSTSASADASPASGTSEAETPSFQTIGDVLSHQENQQYAYDENNYVYVFEMDGTCYRAIADLTPEVSGALNGLDILDETHDERMAEIVSPLEISRLDNLTEQMPSQEELDALVGKTGQELLDDGWTSSGYNLDEGEFWLNKGAYAYTVTFNETVEQTENFDEYEAIGPLTVKSVVCTGIGDATNLE